MVAKVLFTQEISTADTEFPIGPIGVGENWSFSVNFCNRNAVPVKVRLSVSAAAAPAASEYLLYDKTIDALEPFERSGCAAQSGKYIIVRSSAANVSVVGMGYEV